MAWVLEYKKKDKDFSINLRNGCFTIGRGETDLILEDLNVSYHHLTLYIHDDGVVVVDEGSTNGTFINGTRITKQDLKANDILTVGTTNIKVIRK
jgi:pSer/pThr/pTyr-binding forkhead associated (FHA) protein